MVKDWRNTLVFPQETLERAIEIIDASSLQICLVVDTGHRLLGTVTDGDIRRGLIRTHSLSSTVEDVMNPNPLVSSPDVEKAVHNEIMLRASVRQLPLLDTTGTVVGLVIRDDIETAAPLDNWVVLMAGGLGQRLRPMTDHLPKPLLEVGRKPLLETILESFVGYNFNRFFISVNYMADRVKEYIGDGDRWGVDIVYLEEDNSLGTAGSLSLIQEEIEHPLIVMNADVLTKTNFSQLLAFHSEHGAQATMCVREFEFQVPYGVVDIGHGKITRLIEKPSKTYYVNAGIYVLEPTVLSIIEKGSPLNMTDLFQMLIDQGDFPAAFPVREYWLDIGQYEDYRRANGEFSSVFSEK